MSLFRKPNKHGIDCAGACEMMFDYLDGQLSTDESAILTRHLEECGECRYELEQRKKTLNLIQSVDFSVPDKLYPNVMSLIGAAEQEKKKFHICRDKFQRGKLTLNKCMPLGGLAAACAVAVLVLLSRVGMPDVDSASDQALLKNASKYHKQETAGAEMVTGTVTPGFFTMNGDSNFIESDSKESGSTAQYSDGYTNDASKQLENRYYAGATSVLTLAPKLSEDNSDSVSEESVNLLSVYLGGLIEEHSDSAIIVCESDTLNGMLDRDKNAKSENAEDSSDFGTELMVFKADGAENAADEFTGYLNLLRDNGDSFESYVPENSSFTTYYILIVNTTDSNLIDAKPTDSDSAGSNPIALDTAPIESDSDKITDEVTE